MRVTVMEGDFGEFDLASVMQVVSIGRQHTGIDLFDESGKMVGTLLVKSGKILAANTGSKSGMDAVTAMLRESRSRRFAVYRADPLDDVASPVGSIGQVLLRLLDSERKPTPAKTLVMEGSLLEFDLASVMQVVSVGRQLTALELSDASGRPLGVIELKSGRVVSATSDHLSGFDAMRRLTRFPRESHFSVYRLGSSVPDQSLGQVGQILLKLSDPDDGWEASEPNTRAKVFIPSEIPPGKARAKGEREADRAPVPPAPAPAPGPAPLLEPQTSAKGIGVVPPATGIAPVLAITSPKGGTGKTTVLLNLGVALARQGKRVALVDADANGILYALNAAGKPRAGAYEVMGGKTELSRAVMETRVAGLHLIPSGDPAAAPNASAASWGKIFDEARRHADVVLVDTAAGLYGTSGDVCAAATHSLVVIAAEPTSVRALPFHLQRLETIGKPASTTVGIVLNMLDYRARVSLDVLRELCGGPSAPWIFDVPIARSGAFLEAVSRGVPVCRRDRAGNSTIGWVFEMLASGVLERLGLLTPSFDDAILA